MYRKKAPVFSFSILFFFIAHSIESTFFALELIHEHRSYLPLFALSFMFTYYIFKLTEYYKTQYRFLILVGIISFLALNTALRSYYWGNQLLLPLTEVKNHPNSYRARHELARTYNTISDTFPDQKEKFSQLALQHVTRAYDIRPDNPSALFNLITLYYQNDKPVKDKLYSNLFDLLRHKKITDQINHSIDTFITCALKNNCYPTRIQMEGIFKSALSNKKISNENKAKILINAAKCQVSWNNKEAAIKLLQQAANVDDRFETQVLLANTLLDFSFLESASQQINLMRSKNYSPQEIKALSILEKRLSM